MNKIKTAGLLLLTALILLLSSCGGMTADSEDVSIDLSSVTSKAVGDDYNHLKVWLAIEGTNSFYREESFDLATGQDTITLESLPVGPAYKIFMSLGVKTDDIFTVERSANGIINVTGGALTTTTIQSEEIKTTAFTELIGTAVNGAAFIDDSVYTVGADGSVLYYGSTSINEKAAPGDTVLRDVDKGYEDNVIITAKATNGQAVGLFDKEEEVFNFDFSSDLPEAMFGVDYAGDTTIDLLSSYIFYDDDLNMQLGLSQMDGGIVLSVYGEFDYGEGTETATEWLAVDFSEVLEALEEFEIDLSGEFFKGFSVLSYENTDGDEYVWLFVASKLGNFRFQIPLNEDGLDDSAFDDEDVEGEDTILNMFTDFALNNTYLEDRVVLNLGNYNNDYLFVGTDSGLYKMTAEASVSDMEAEEIFAEGERIELLACSEDYTACVTAMELLVINNENGNVARVAFNQGLPALGKLNDDGITGLAWDDSTLYVAGSYGLVSLDVSPANVDLDWETE
ncbi:MAG: hypothetical protein PQJ61_11385 [Spirochaetales bacterium]|uniref:Uncharacterized protein n=1 Tax=Candidatus Thalassospirochaeta sargassi TaxID=3119039 RepID=A0AAJ1IDQ5_9SPIO|nr:hypothetical protein [Spirochaetales bacterium]